MLLQTYPRHGTVEHVVAKHGTVVRVVANMFKTRDSCACCCRHAQDMGQLSVLQDTGQLCVLLQTCPRHGTVVRVVARHGTVVHIVADMLQDTGRLHVLLQTTRLLRGSGRRQAAGRHGGHDRRHL